MHQFYWPSNLLTGDTHLDHTWTAGMFRPMILTDCIDFSGVSMLCSRLLENGQQLWDSLLIIILGTHLQKALSSCVKKLEYMCLSFMSSKLDWTDMIHL